MEHQGVLSSQAWEKLSFITDPLCDCCGAPFPFEAAPGSLCGMCISTGHDFDSARASVVYNDVSRDFILKFKHGDQLHAIHTFIPWLRRTGHSMLENADLLVPVPLHRWRLLKRRYNQAAILALSLGRTVNKDCLPDALMRIRSTPVQGHLNRSERRKNVRKAFAINPRHADKIKGKRIILIDDVMTTGATVGECAKTLKKAGAERVDILALARVVKPE